MLVNETPIEHVGGNVWVKREDLCSPYPGPGFAKIRGVLAHVRARPEGLIGVLDTYHSKAGWAVAYVCRALGKRCVDFFPVYKADGDALRPQQAMAHGLGADLVPLPAGRSAILYHTARRETVARGGYVMPNALKLPETVAEVADEVVRTPGLSRFEHLVISVSSGTIAAGVLSGFARLGLAPRTTFHLGYDRSREALLSYVRGYVPSLDAFRPEVVDEGYGYKDKARGAEVAPFPCNPYYDLKAWQWLRRQDSLPPTLFWNVGC
jgi:hypothetical protein